MCRFLIIIAEKQFDATSHLNSFAELCKNSEEFQGDGWGVCYPAPKQEGWKCHRSIKPIWQEQHLFDSLPATKILVAHARSSFQDRGPNIEFTQPFVNEKLVFVFNGEISGVKIRARGNNGAQKLFTLIQQNSSNGYKEALQILKRLIEDNSEHIKAMNVGLLHQNKIYVLCKYSERPNYFGLHYYNGKDENEMQIVCSQPYGSYDFKPIPNNQVLVI
ncbi:hypothetical protein KY320_03810 [Candidatus Woesearchaeota archaeon]|nr:hypothetical protein [Candidatus Woesearchaeota archaeon]